ncbi:MAG: UDP-N-acetylglucosamine pyrophosphorylase [Myxococcales bacterium]|nr:UDP-N-acetylglucosamine pyrophosphorylase [Myxococcales bacterium]MCB9750392.1 UDP-N-acetylglucosamine pyrophosphorylase [Myxococcales bacterium]
MRMDDSHTRAETLDLRLQQLARRGVTIVDPRQTFVDDDVDIARVESGVVLHPGTRLHGARTYLSAGVEVGHEGPAVLRDVVLGPRARVASGFVHGAVLLRDASLGANAHVRPGTLLEEEASTAHAVGLKHTILMSFVTLGSLINFCDALMTGGTSRSDHSEVGSGYIHFNYTPWGARGDKATPSLVGDVPRGVLLRERRIFLGGSGGMIGPRRVGFGAVAGAGQVLRRDVPADHLSVQTSRTVLRALSTELLGPCAPRREQNIRYIANLEALRAFYRELRLPRLPGEDEFAGEREVLEAAIETLSLAIRERVKRLAAFLEERGERPPAFRPRPRLPCPLEITRARARDYVDHVRWIQGRTDLEANMLRGWLIAIVEDRVQAEAG